MCVKAIFGSSIFALFLFTVSGCYYFLPTHTAAITESYSSDGVENLSVTNITGNVTITQGIGDSIVVKAVKTGWVQEDLEYVKVAVTEGETLSIVSDYSYHPSSSVSIDYFISLPPGISVTVQNTTGNVSIDGATSVGSVSIVTGDISVMHCETISELGSTTGTIRAEIQDTNGDITIRTTTGNITVWVDPAISAVLYYSVITGSYTGPKIIPAGEHRINVSVVTGNITVYNL